MQQIMGYIRRAVTEYHMIEAGDRIGVGVSGGKDSVALLVGLAGVRRYLGIPFDIVAITLDNGFEGQPSYSPITDLCREFDIEHVIKPTQIAKIIFEIRKESNPCSLCARMRRGVLHDTCNEHGCNKLALGHHYNDAVETFLMNLFNEGRVGCFSPVSYLSRKDLTLIRPLVFAPERDIRNTVRRKNLPVVKNKCPVDGCTRREWTKQFLQELEGTHNNVTRKIFNAMRRAHISGW